MIKSSSCQKIYILFSLFGIFAVSANAGLFSSKEGKTFETRGSAVVMAEGTFTLGVEQRDIPVPRYINVESMNNFSGLTHDSESGWTKCRVPLKGKFGLTGMTNRSLVFDCKPLSYFQ